MHTQLIFHYFVTLTQIAVFVDGLHKNDNSSEASPKGGHVNVCVNKNTKILFCFYIKGSFLPLNSFIKTKTLERGGGSKPYNNTYNIPVNFQKNLNGTKVVVNIFGEKYTKRSITLSCSSYCTSFCLSCLWLGLEAAALLNYVFSFVLNTTCHLKTFKCIKKTIRIHQKELLIWYRTLH